MAISTPKRFIPINEWVYFPDWANEVSHDVPFSDGLNGSIDLTIKAITELMVGGARREATSQLEGEVWPFQLPDGTWAIPQSSLQGAIRAIVSMASFGAIGGGVGQGASVKEKRFGLRDLTRDAENYYGGRLNQVSGHNPTVVKPRIKVGWLRKVDEGFELRRCELARIEYEDLSALLNVQLHRLRRRSSAEQRYRLSQDVTSERRLFVTEKNGPHRHKRGQLRLYYYKAKDTETPDATRCSGNVVLTGNVRDYEPNRSDKHMEFFFHTIAPQSETNAITEKLFSDFVAIHEPDDGRKANETWLFFKNNGYGTDPITGEGGKPFKRGGWMPIFYLEEEGQIKSFGLAFMFKLAHHYTTQDLLGHSATDHMIPAPDLARLIFGTANAEDDGTAKEKGNTLAGLKRRAWFDLGLVQTKDIKTVRSEPVVLSSPKPYPNIYVAQPGALKNGARAKGRKVHTYSEPADGEKLYPKLAGRSVWPATIYTAAEKKHSFNYKPDLPNNRSTQVRLNALPTGTELKTTLRFHNLKPQELGALIWALSLPDRMRDGAAIHRLGGGKPLGMGQVEIKLGELSATSNDGGALPCKDEVCQAFISHMNKAFPKDSTEGKSWEASRQIRSLLAASNPAVNAGLNFKYMKLGRGKQDNTYTGEKAKGRVLPLYLTELDQVEKENKSS